MIQGCQQLTSNSELKDKFEIIEKESFLLSSTINDILDYSEIYKDTFRVNRY
jgi:hypothetical protein